jgi:hypothetical protein
MARSWVLLSAILATVGVALAGCAAPFSRGLLCRRLSLRNPQLLLRRVECMARGKVCRCWST